MSLETHDLAALAAALPTLDLATGPTYEQAMASMASLGALGGLRLGVARFRGQPPWEKHPDDELIYVLDGAVDVTLLEDSGPSTVTLEAGALFVVPAGTWHRSSAPESVTSLVATSAEGNERSLAEDPRE